MRAEGIMFLQLLVPLYNMALPHNPHASVFKSRIGAHSGTHHVKHGLVIDRNSSHDLALRFALGGS
jgi:hypothetical protein